MKKIKLTPQIATDLTNWFKENQRDLPWRNTNNPYDVWISEIMLQQTRVEAVKEKFIQFRKSLVTIQDLAEIEMDVLMKLWEGLGYYSRAKNLKKCAIQLVENHNGKLPNNLFELQKLAGIGPYTAGAIASIAFSIPTPAIDGNVLRVLTRLFGITDDIRSNHTKQLLTKIVQNFFDQDSTQLILENKNFVSDFNQGLMELGALICIPNGNPLCNICPWKHYCYAYQNNMLNTIPFRSALKKRRIIKRTIFIIWDDKQFILHKRSKKGLLADLYEFPGCDDHLTIHQAQKFVEQYGVTALRIKHLPNAKHIFTHLEWNMIAYEIKVASIETLQLEDSLLITKKELSHLAIPSAFKVYIDYYSLHD